MSYSYDCDEEEPSYLRAQPQILQGKKTEKFVADDDFVYSSGRGGKEDYTWRKGANGSVPLGAFIACKSNNLGDIYVGRCFHKGEVLPGKFIPKLRCCIVGYEGEEVKKYNYEVLCNVKAEWIPMKAGPQNIPNNAVLGGKTQDSESLYIGRVLDKSSVGKVLEGDCLVVYGNKEHVHKNFEVLVTSSNPTEMKAYSGYDPKFPSMTNRKVIGDQHNLMKMTRGQHMPFAPRVTTYDEEYEFTSQAHQMKQHVPFSKRVTTLDEEESSYLRAHPLKPMSSRNVPDDDFVTAAKYGVADYEEPSYKLNAAPRMYGVKPNSPRFVTDEDLVASSGGGDVAWTRARNGDYPTNAVVGGSNHHGDIYVARAEFQGQLIPGKLIPAYRCCFISVNGIEMKVKDYEVLQCNQPTMLEWNTMETGDGIPMNAVEGGVDDVGDALFIGRVEHGDSAIVGKVVRFMDHIKS